MRRRQGNQRSVNGILLLDKPSGLTSNKSLQIVKTLYRARKAGHTGSLDPLASGLLPVCFGEATKVSGFLLDADKHYQVSCKLGERTSTGDAEGEIIASSTPGDLDLARIEAVVEHFRGVVDQVPPMYSAIKHKGQRLYKLARQGVEVERKARTITIHSLSILQWDSPILDIDVHCSKGTYVRTLAEDIGEMLGCGAHVAGLRRLGVGPYEGTDNMIGLEELRDLAEQGPEALDKFLLPMESGLSQWPDVCLSSDAAYYLRQGQPVLVPHAPTDGWVRLFANDHKFLGMGQILDDGRVAPRRLVNIA